MILYIYFNGDIMNRLKQFVINSMLVVFSSIIVQIIKLAFNIYVSNKVSPEAMGVFQLIMVTYYFGITLASSGINISCMKVVSEEDVLSNNYGVQKSSKLCIKISLILSLIISIIFYIKSEYIVTNFFHNKVSLKIVYLICFALPLISASSAISGYFTAVRRIYKIIIGQFLEQISKIIFICFLFKYYSKNWTLDNICFSLILGDVLSELVAFVYLIFTYNIDMIKYFKIKKMRKSHFLQKILHILIPISITSCIKSGISTYKQLIIPSSLEKSGKNCNESLGIYGIISGMAMPIILFPSMFVSSTSSLLIPEFSRYSVKKDTFKIKNYTDKLILGTFLFSLLFTIIFYNFSNVIGNVIYHSNKVSLYIKIFSLLIPYIYVDIVIDNILKGLNFQTDVMIINIIDLIVSTSFIFIFVPIFGIVGYIISIFISEFLNLTLSLYKLLKLEKTL